MPPKKGKKAAAKKSPIKKEVEQQSEEELLQEPENETTESTEEEMEVKLEEEEANGTSKRTIDDVENGDGDEGDDDDGSKKMKTEDEDEDPNKPITLFCGNLDPDLSTETLEKFFTANDVEVTDARKIKWKRFGYVNVRPDQLEAAIALTGKQLNGTAIRVDKSKPKERESQKNEADDRTLFVKNLHEGTTEETLRQFFKDFGKVLQVRLPKKPDGSCKGFGYVVFDCEKSVEEAKEAKQGAELNGEKLFLDFTNEKSEHFKELYGPREYGPSKVLFVRNVSFQVTEEELKETFDGCLAVRIPPNPYGNPKGFAFIEYPSIEDAEQARKDKDGLEINGRVVQIAFADDKESGDQPRKRPMRRGRGMFGPRGRGMWGAPWPMRGGWGPGGWGWGRGGRGMGMPMGWGGGFGGPRMRGRGGRKRY